MSLQLKFSSVSHFLKTLLFLGGLRKENHRDWDLNWEKTQNIHKYLNAGMTVLDVKCYAFHLDKRLMRLLNSVSLLLR